MPHPARPLNPNPLAPYEKVGKIKIDLDVVLWILFAGITIVLCVELLVFTVAVFGNKEHATLDAIIAWTGLCWFTTIVLGCIYLFGAGKSTFPGS